jgi:hypothetical protein
VQNEVDTFQRSPGTIGRDSDLVWAAPVARRFPVFLRAEWDIPSTTSFFA